MPISQKNLIIISSSEIPNYHIILSKYHHGTQLILRRIHENNLHVGREHTLAISRQHWIPSCRVLIRNTPRNCVKSRNECARPQSNLMGDVPKERVSIGDKQFLNTGIDYFGLYHVKMNKGTRSNSGTANRYGVLFTCLTTRTVHIELAKDLSTDAFIMTLRRFISRRGNVQVIRLDNGTNFVGANKELKSCVRQLDQPRIIRCLSQNWITWIFNPPVSPWMGGIWESRIKSVKRSLKAIIKDRIFTEDCLHTFLCEVESILNGRPLTAISNDITDLEPFTPKHILIGSSSSNFSPGKFNSNEINLRKKWRSAQAAPNMFWKRWVRKDLPLLSIRKKWSQKL